jgi:hypothetical protein
MNPGTAAAEVAVLEWLLQADPSLRWQVLRDLTDCAAPTLEESSSARMRTRMAQQEHPERPHHI